MGGVYYRGKDVTKQFFPPSERTVKTVIPNAERIRGTTPSTLRKVGENPENFKKPFNVTMSALVDRYNVDNLTKAGYEVTDTGTHYTVVYPEANHEPKIEEKLWIKTLGPQPKGWTQNYDETYGEGPPWIGKKETIWHFEKSPAMRGVMITDKGIRNANLKETKIGDLEYNPKSGKYEESQGGQGECCVFNSYGGGGCGPCNRGGGPVILISKYWGLT